MTNTSTVLTVHPIDATELDAVREDGIDQFGNVPEQFQADGGEQLRCCLRLSQPGERLWTISHAPLTTQRPWREVGPVFTHADQCPGYLAPRELPGFLYGQPRVLRCYTADHAMHYPANRVTADDDLDVALQEAFADPEVAEVHVRNLLTQCFIARITRDR